MKRTTAPATVLAILCVFAFPAGADQPTLEDRSAYQQDHLVGLRINPASSVIQVLPQRSRAVINSSFDMVSANCIDCGTACPPVARTVQVVLEATTDVDAGYSVSNLTAANFSIPNVSYTTQDALASGEQVTITLTGTVLNCDNWFNVFFSVCDRATALPTDPCDTYRPTCLAILSAAPGATDGVYWLDPDGNGTGNPPMQAFCDMTTTGGGWTRVAYERAGSPNPASVNGTMRYLSETVGLAEEVANATGDGLFGARFAGLYGEVRIEWSGDSAQFIPAGEVFTNTVDLTIPVSGFSTSDPTLATWVTIAGGAIFCRASRFGDIRPGDTSWAVKAINDNNFSCGCNSGGWAGQGAFYGGTQNGQQTVCTGWGGGWAGVRDHGQQKGGINIHTTSILVR